MKFFANFLRQNRHAHKTKIMEKEKKGTNAIYIKKSWKNLYCWGKHAGLVEVVSAFGCSCVVVKFIA